MVHNEIHAIDLAIIAAYLIAMVLIGLVVVKKVKSMDDYYLGGRSFGPLVLMATVCATIIGGSGLMGRAGVAYSSGFKAIMTALPYLLGMFIFSGFAGRISDVGRKFNVTSIPDLFEQRFGKPPRLAAKDEEVVRAVGDLTIVARGLGGGKVHLRAGVFFHKRLPAFVDFVGHQIPVVEPGAL